MKYLGIMRDQVNPRHLLILQPYLPAYRVPLFDSIAARGARANIVVRVVTGAPKGAQAARGDARTAPWHSTVPSQLFSAMGREFKIRRSLSPHLRWADTVVTELDPSNLDLFQLLGRKKVVLWGHGKSYVNHESRMATYLKVRMTRRAAATLTYTTQGANYLISNGSPHRKVHAIGNATDTRTLRRERLIAEAREGANDSSLSALYVGALDAGKRLDVLLEAAKVAYMRDSGFTLTVAGEGPLRSKVEEGRSYGVRAIGYAPPTTLATLATQASAMWNPGRVGLNAIDCAALGLPLITTRYRFHAPELELLTEGVDYVVAPDDPSQFAEEALKVMATPFHPRPIEDLPSIESVADNFCFAVFPLVHG